VGSLTLSLSCRRLAFLRKELEEGRFSSPMFDTKR
jgi:hypothetical protein